MNMRLTELIQELSPEQQEQVLDYVQYLLIQPAVLEKKPDVGGPGPDAVVRSPRTPSGRSSN